MDDGLQPRGAAANADPVSEGVELADQHGLAIDGPGGLERSRPDRRTGREVILICANSIRPQPISWVWDGWLAAGKFHILAGQPGTGKTTIALAFAAVVSRGELWPDGTRADPGNVLIWSGEDDLADTLVPRLLAMNSDVSRVHFVGDIREGCKRRSFDPARDISELELEARRIGGCRLLIVDPVVSAVAGDSHKNAETRKDLQPLVDLAARLDCAVIGITHFTKGTSGREPIERVTGSIAFGALPRVVLMAATLPAGATGEPAGRVLVRAKSNIGQDRGGFAYDLRQVSVPDHTNLAASRVIWGSAIDRTARAVLADTEPVSPATGDQGEVSMTDEAVDLLKTALHAGALLSQDVKNLATEAGISAKALRRAREQLRVRSRREGFGKDTKTFWALPEDSLMPSHINEAQRNAGAVIDEKGTNDEVCPS